MLLQEAFVCCLLACYMLLAWRMAACLVGLDLTEVPYFHFYYRSIFVRLAGMANKRERERERISLSHVWRALTHRAGKSNRLM